MLKSKLEKMSRVSETAIVSNNTNLGANCDIGHFTIIGSNDGEGVIVGENCLISHHAIIEPGVRIGNNCVIDAYCRVCSGVEVDDNSRVLYGASVFDDARIGKKCIIGGDVADRTIIEDYVTYFGEIAHDYRVPGDIDSWDMTPRPSPIIKTRSVIGQNALLLGGIQIGPKAYVSAGEIVRCNVPADKIYIRGEIKDISLFKGLIQVRSDV